MKMFLLRHGAVVVYLTLLHQLLGAFTKLKKSDLLLRHASVRPHGTTRLPLDGFS